MASVLGSAIAYAYSAPCQSEKCLLLISRLNQSILFDRYYLEVIDQGGTLRDALMCNAVIFCGAAVALLLFVSRLVAEIRERKTRLAGDDRKIWLLLGGIGLFGFAVLFNVVDSAGKPLQKSIYLVIQASIVAASCLERALVQFMARYWDHPLARNGE